MFELGEPDPLPLPTLEELAKQVDRYHPNSRVVREFGKRSLEFVSISGPFGVGKTAITDLVTALEPRIRPINTTTDRPGKPSDPEGFRTASHGITQEQIIRDIVAGEVINYTVVGEHIYATYPDGFTAEINIGPITSDNINTMINSGFSELTPIYVISPVPMWAAFIKKSLGDRSDTSKIRAPETIDSISFAKNNLELFQFVENKDDENGPFKAAQSIARIVNRQTNPNVTLQYANQTLDEMLAYAKSLA